MSQFIERIYGVAKARAERGEVWGSICAVTYADTITLNQAMSGVEVSISGKLVATTPVPSDTSAKSLVDAMRRVLINALPEEHRDRVETLFSPVDFLSELEAPEDTSVQAASLRGRTEGLKPHAYKARRVSDSKVHARASKKMIEAGVDEVDVHAAIRASDVAVFEVTSVEYSLSHADWQLEGHSVRMELADEVIKIIDPSEDKEILRRALKTQFEGIDFTTEIQWIVV